MVDEDDVDTRQSISLGADDREPTSMSALLGRNLAAEEDEEAANLQPAAAITATDSADMLQQGSSSAERESRPPGGLFSGYSSSPYGRRYGSGNAGRGVTPPQSGSGSLAGSGGRYGRGYSRGGGGSGFGAPGGPTDETEEEPLLFDMSEINNIRQQSRRSLEEGRGGGSMGGSGADRGGSYESAHRNRRWQ